MYNPARQFLELRELALIEGQRGQLELLRVVGQQQGGVRLAQPRELLGRLVDFAEDLVDPVLGVLPLLPLRV